MKRIIYIIMAAVVCLSLCACGGVGGKGTAAQEIDVSSLVQLPQYALQDLRTWGQGEVSMPDKPIDMDGYVVYKYKLDQNILDEYLAALQNNGFTLVDEYSMRSFRNTYKSYGLVCDEAADAAMIEQMYSGTHCHVNIWKDGGEWRVDAADGITLCDAGLRRDGSVVSVQPQGQSAGAGLKQKGKSYKTTDGRFEAKAGQADVTVDGQQETVPASWKRSGEKITVTAEISDTMSAEIVLETDKATVGDIWQLCSVEELPVTFKLINGDDDIGISQKGAAHFHTVTVRLMYLDEDNNTALYLYAEPVNTENYPQSVELLCAVNTTPEQKEGGGGGDISIGGRDSFQPDHSKQDCLSCHGSGDCDECGGALYVYYGGNRAKCGTCKGTGDCRTCGGSGKR